MLLQKQRTNSYHLILRISILVFFCSIIFFVIDTGGKVLAVSSITHTAYEDFEEGEYDSNVSIDSIPGSIVLNNNSIHHTQEEFSTSGERDVDTLLERTTTSELSDGLELDLINNGYCFDSSKEQKLREENNFFFTPEKSFALDEQLGLLFVSNEKYLDVVETKNTPTPTDDVIHYLYTSPDSPIDRIIYDELSKYIYVATVSNGVRVIDTKGTISNSDDEITAQYNTSSTPALPSNNIRDVYYNPYLETLYIAIENLNVFAIDTNGTGSILDDVLLGNLGLSDESEDIIYDPNSGYLYVANSMGLYVKDTKKTKTLADDEQIALYNMSSTPALPRSDVEHVELSDSGRYVYLAAGSHRFYILDTDTNELIFSYYHTESTFSNIIWDFWIEEETNSLYVTSQLQGLMVFDIPTGEVKKQYKIADFYSLYTDSIPDYANYARDVRVLNDTLYIKDGNMLCAKYLGNPLYFPTAYYTSDYFPISTTNLNISWEEDKTLEEEVFIQTRVGKNTIFIDEFDDGDVSNLEDESEWGSIVESIEESNGIVTLSGLSGNYADLWIDFGVPELSFTLGTKVSARVRSVSPTEDEYLEANLFYDDWGDADDNVDFEPGDSDWKILELVSAESFTRVGLEFYDPNGFEQDDYIEIDWVHIEYTDWNDWSAPCLDSSGCYLEGLDEYNSLQYRLTLVSSDDMTSSPLVSSVTIIQNYSSSGTYVSSVLDSGESGSTWQELVSQTEIPSGTSVLFSTRTGDTPTPDATWSTWQIVDDSIISSPDGRYLQYNVILATEDYTKTPIVEHVEISFILPNHPVSITNLNANLNPIDTITGLNLKIPSTKFKSADRVVRLYKQDGQESILIGETLVDMTSTRNWESITADTDVTSKKSFIHGLSTADGASNTFRLFVPRALSDNRVRVCFNSSSLESVSLDCSSGDTFSESNSNVSIVFFGGQSYWSIMNMTGTGGISFRVNTQLVSEQPEIEPEEVEEELEPEDETEWEGSDEGSDIKLPENEDTESKKESMITSFVKKVGSNISTIYSGTLDSISNADIDTPSTRIVVVGSFSTMLVTYLFNMFSVGKDSSLITLPFLSSIFTLGKLRKKTQNYGIVYDSVTKEPIRQAIVRVTDMSNRLVTTVVTDIYGIFDLDLPSSGYKISVDANGFTFPSVIIQTSEDYPYRNIYHGGVINHTATEPLNISIPMDRLNSGFVEESGASIRNILSTIWNILVTVFFIIGLLTTVFALINNPTSLIWLVFCIYLLFVCLYMLIRVKGLKKFGYVVDTSRNPLSGIQLGLVEQEFGQLYAKRVTDGNGKYRFIVPTGKYKLVVLNEDYSVVNQKKEIFEVKDNSVLVIKQDITLRRK